MSRTSAQVPYPRRTIRTVIVDDAADAVDVLVHGLGRFEEIEVIATAANGSDAVSLVRAMRPDVVLMDLRMPVMGGIKATKCIVEEGLPSRVLMLTGYDDDSLVRDAMEAGADGYLVKGTLVADIVQAMHAAVEQSQIVNSRRGLHLLES
jgi:DNA-binding NarL/FixJ family response regulator